MQEIKAEIAKAAVQKQNKKMLYIGIAAVVVILLIAIAFFMLPGPVSPEPPLPVCKNGLQDKGETKRAARKDEISAILKEQIKGFRYDLDMNEVGVVVEVGDGIARVFGGGGHAQAAGCLVEGELEEVERRVLAELRRRLATKGDHAG